jgi:hypothetical protein
VITLVPAGNGFDLAMRRNLYKIRKTCSEENIDGE